MKFLELKKHLAQGNLFPCYLATGEDGYLLRKTKEEFSALVTVFPQLNLSVFSDFTTPAQVFAAAQTLPVLGDKRVVIAPFIGDVSEYLKNPSKSSVVLFYTKEDKTLKGAELIDCGKLDRKTLLQVIAAKALNGITTEAAELLIDYCVSSLERIDIELKKLTTYAGESPIKREDVVLLVSPELEYKVFELTEMIFKKNAARALTLLNEMLLEGAGSGPKVYGLLYNHFRRLIYTALTPSQKQLALELGIKEYAVKMASYDAKKLTQVKLKKLLDALHLVDYGFKNGKGSDKILLENFIISAISEIG